MLHVGGVFFFHLTAMREQASGGSTLTPMDKNEYCTSYYLILSSSVFSVQQTSVLEIQLCIFKTQ